VPLRHEDEPDTLLGRIDGVFQRRDQPLEHGFANTHNGAFMLESLPAAIGAFLHHAEDPEQAIVATVAGGYDADTVAAMAGALVGAYHGASALPARWIDDLEFASGLAGLADDLCRLAGLGSDHPPLPWEPPHVRYDPQVVDGVRWITHAHLVAAEEVDDSLRDLVRLQPHATGARVMAERIRLRS
jgi:hypothetical protein